MKLLVIVTALLFIAAMSCAETVSPPRPSTSAPTSTPQGIGPVMQVPGTDVATPDFTLPSASGENIRLSDYRGKQSFILIFYRGFF